MANLPDHLAETLAMAKLTSPWWCFVILGAVAGTFSGMLGLGAGVIIVPSLVLIFALPQKTAQGTALSLMAPMALLGAIRYWRNPEIDLNFTIVIFLVCGAFFGVLLGTDLAARLPGYALRKIVAVVLIVVAIRMFIGPTRHNAKPTANPTTETQQPQQSGESPNGPNQ